MSRPTKKGAHPADPRGLILEAYNIENLSEKDCRTIFLDWALGVPAESDIAQLMPKLAEYYAELNPGASNEHTAEREHLQHAIHPIIARSILKAQGQK